MSQDAAKNMTLREELRSPRLWILGSIGLAALLCALVAALHYTHEKSMATLFSALEQTRLARLDLANGFLHAMMSKDPGTPFDRTRGLALLRQGMDNLDASLAGSDANRAELDSALLDFKDILERWIGAKARSPGDETVLRNSFHRLEMLAETLDRQIRISMKESRARHDMIFKLSLWGAALALAGICLTLHKLWKEQMKAEAKTRESEARFRYVLESSGEAVYRWKASSMEFDYISPASEEILGWSPGSMKEMSSARLERLIALEDLQLVKDAIAKLLEGKERKCLLEFRIARPDGSLRWVSGSANAVPSCEGRGTCCIVGAIRDVDGRMRAEESLRANEEKFRLLVENLPQMVFLKDLERNYVFCNDKFANHLGIRKSQALGHKDSDILPLHASALLETQDLEVIGNDKAIDVEHMSFVRPGMWLQTIKIPLKSQEGKTIGMLGLLWDITPRKQAELELDRERVIVKSVFESVPGLLFLYDENLQLMRWNSKLSEISGYSEAELSKKRIYDWFCGKEERLKALDEALKRIESDGQVEFEIEIATKDGREIPFFISAVGLELDGRKYITGVGLDITGQRKDRAKLAQANAGLERRVVERTAELKVAKEKAEAADRLKSAFLATMSHELRTPMNSILGFTGIMLQGLAGPVNDEQRKQLEMVRRSGKHLLDLINGVLDISKIEAGQMELRKSPFDLKALVEEAAASVAPAAERKGLALKVVAPAPRPVFSDQLKVRQILINLLNNAIKFTNKGEVSVKIHEPSEGKATVSVSDTGMGIMEQDIKKLFTPFRQLDAGIDRKHEGSGLGLAICKSLARLLEGEISVKSEWGKGSAFALTLPLTQEEPGK